MTATLDWAEQAARQFDPRTRRWATPGLMAVELDHETNQTPALDLVDATIVATVEDNDQPDKAIICMPPQNGKSQRVTRRTPLWLLENNPKLRIVLVSYESDIATRWGRQIKRDIEENPTLNLTLRADSSAAGRWETLQGGGIYCVGIKGAFTGRPADVLIIDDPLKDRPEAESELARNRCWEFWENVAKVRSRKVILVMTRWHADDLAGRLLEREPDEWALVSIPAIADSDNDALGREVGEEIQSANPVLHPPGYFRRMMASASSYVWASLFQQRPTLAAGNIFKRADWRYWEPLGSDAILIDGFSRGLEDCYRFITMDLATSLKTSADYTVAAAWAITPDGQLVLLDRVRERVPQLDHDAFLAPLRQRWLNMFDVTYIESRMFGSTLVYALGRKGVPIAELEADVDKLTRALSAADLVKQNRVFLPRTADWLDAWLDEHAEFPNTRHDDQVDVTAYAARVALTRWLPEQSEQHAPAATRTRELDLLAIPY